MGSMLSCPNLNRDLAGLPPNAVVAYFWRTVQTEAKMYKYRTRASDRYVCEVCGAPWKKLWDIKETTPLGSIDSLSTTKSVELVVENAKGERKHIKSTSIDFDINHSTTNEEATFEPEMLQCWLPEIKTCLFKSNEGSPMTCTECKCVWELLD